MKRFALALDIDGVFLRGSKVLTFASATIKKIQKENIPFIFITNGGKDRKSCRYRLNFKSNF